MSCFNHDTFGAGHMPPFGKIFDIKEKKNSFRTTISETIGDAEYEDITNEQPKAKKGAKYDKVARAKEISERLDKLIADLASKGDSDSLVVAASCVLFIQGAEWSDCHPVSNYKSEYDRFNAFREEMDRTEKEMASKDGKRDPLLTLLVVASLTMGLKWATSNPPKYQA